MDEVRQMLERQAEWQRSRARLSWAEKLSTSLVLRRAQRALRQPASAVAPDPSAPGGRDA